MSYLLNGAPSFILHFDGALILWGLPSGFLIQTRTAKLFIDGGNHRVTMQGTVFERMAEWDSIAPNIKVDHKKAGFP